MSPVLTAMGLCAGSGDAKAPLSHLRRWWTEQCS